MTDYAWQTSYVQELVNGFEQQQALLRDAVTTEQQVKGNVAVFDVVSSGGATASTRGINGLIAPRTNSHTQNSCTLEEWNDLAHMTGFNIFASQGEQVPQLQRTCMAVINKKIDYDILAALATGTVDANSASVTASLALILKAKAILGRAEVPFDGNIWAAISPDFEAYMLLTREFTDQNFVGRKPLDTGETAWSDKVGYYSYAGVKFIVHPKLPGVGTSDEKCIMWHKSAIGHAIDKSGINAELGYNGEQNYTWARCTAYMGSKLLQNSGVVIMHHDGTTLPSS